LSFIVSGFGCLFAGCATLNREHDSIAGSAYTYGYATLGEFIAWIIGWDLILEYLFGASTVAVGWSGYFTAFMEQIGIHMPPAFTKCALAVPRDRRSRLCDASGHPPRRFSQTGAVLNLPAMVLIALMTTLLVIGIKESARFNNFIVISRSRSYSSYRIRRSCT